MLNRITLLTNLTFLHLTQISNQRAVVLLAFILMLILAVLPQTALANEPDNVWDEIAPTLAHGQNYEVGQIGLRVDIINGGRDILIAVVEQTESGLEQLETTTVSCSERAAGETCQQFALRLFNLDAEDDWGCEFEPADDCDWTVGDDNGNPIIHWDNPCVHFLIFGWCPAKY